MSSRDYWKRRSLQLEQLIYSRANETVAQISRLYDQAQREMVEQIEGVFNTFSRKGALTQAQAMSLLSVKKTEEARAELLEQYQTATGDVKQDLWARLAAPAYANRISRLQALRDRLYAQARMVGLEEVSLVRDRLEDALCQSYYRTVYDTQREAGAYYDFNLLSDNQIKAALAANWSGKNWSERIWDNNQAFANAVQDTVTLGLMTGQRYDEIRDNLLYTIGMDSTAGARYRAARLVRTECNYIANQGHLMGYRAAGLEQYIFLATLDLRTSEICRSLDGRRFDLAQAQAGTNLPPMHPNCRSTTIPADAAQLLSKIKRAARNPVTGKTVQVPGDMTYREWYEQYVSGKEQPNKGPEDVLEEYLSTATPGKGAVTYDDGYDKGKFKDEVATAQWLHDNLGGDVQVLRDANRDKVKTPDYLWRKKFWELKSVTTEKAADTAVRKALKQISGNPGGVILNYGGNNISLNEVVRIINDRIGRGCDFDVDVMIIQNQEAKRILRYKK